MVLESLSSPFRAIKHPAVLILYGFVYSVVALLLAINTFPSHTSIVFIALIILASVPLMFAIIKEEEKKDIADFHEVALLKEHSKALKAFMALFLGILLGVALFYVFSPLAVLATGIIVIIAIIKDKEDNKDLRIVAMIVIAAITLLVGYSLLESQPVLSNVFEAQIQTLNNLGNSVSGKATEVTGNATAFGTFMRIFTNNIKVLLFCILFSFLYGSGAIFVLTWNASVIGVAIGNYIRSNLAAAAETVGFSRVVEYLAVVKIGLLQYAIHGIPEILSYFVAGLAGGIISIAVIRHDFKGKKFEHVVLDAADLILLSLGLVFLAAVLEVWITPAIF